MKVLSKIILTNIISVEKINKRHAMLRLYPKFTLTNHIKTDEINRRNDMLIKVTSKRNVIQTLHKNYIDKYTIDENVNKPNAIQSYIRNYIII